MADNITFSVGTEDAAALTSFLKLSKAEQALEVQTLKGNVAYKKRTIAQRAATDEAGRAARAAEREAAAQKRLEDRERSRAKASLAAQKSRALQANIEKEMSRQRAIAQGFEAQAAKAQLAAGDRDHKRRIARQRELVAATERQRQGFVGGVRAAGRFAKSIGAVGAVASGVSAAFMEMTAQHRHLMEEAQRSDVQASGLREFVALQAPGEGGAAHVKRTVLQGARAGVSAQDVGVMAQPIQSVVDANGDGVLQPGEQSAFDTDFGAALKLRQVGISAKDAQTVVTSGRGRGVGGDVSADKLIIASDRSAAGPADFARGASAMGQFADTDAALAMTTALSKEEKNFEQLPTLIRGLGQVLGAANDESKFSQKFGLAGLGEGEKIAALRDYALRNGDQSLSASERVGAFSRTFKNEGLDEEKARALGIAVRQGDTVTETMAALRGADVAGVADRKVGALRSDPIMGSLMRSEEAQAATSADALFGVEAEKARDERAKALARGMQLMQYGGKRAVDPMTGEAKEFGINADPGDLFGLRSGASVIAGTARAALNGMPGTGLNAPVLDQGASGASQLEQAMQLHREALEKNTAAIEKQAQSSGAGAGALGAVGNSEERS